MDDRVVISGIGSVTPLGITTRQTWAGLLAGRSGVDRISLFDPSDLPTRIAAEVRGFDAGAYLAPKQANRTSRTSQFAVVAAREAIRDAGLPSDLSETEAAVILNSAVSGFAEVQEATEAFHSGGTRRISPRFVPSSLTNMPACEIAIDLGVHGPVNASALACASGAHALVEARRLVLSGDADVVLAGGADASITPVMFAGLSAMRALSRRNDSPAEASRPFDADRDGFVFGEGAVVMVVERLSRAQARGATGYAEILGGALTSDAFNIVAPEPSGRYATRAITRALRAARLDPGDVDLVCAHGTSTRANDRTETAALRQALGAAADDVAVSAPKSMVGHLIGAAGAVAGLVCALAISEGVIPPTLNYTTPDPDCDLDYVPGCAREQSVRHAFTNAFGFGGQNCVVAFGAI
ncbi:beta-ketoacyl-ACP synthase II [Pseudactinotalea sp. HY160]|uniref:beta-ketoacyl-ACP synthase II n=1 Tax=Pseudactinotalea sp. HY160 TaxID=2654490 RepID=UPI00128C1705|nr:beta-ketoacyl-ACP synthase II [Pseudactinotalea sp. HY160]MPV48763.1 beta-ketoacyl-ACP synthase II [Pseudactinotalea sp. HY160]